MGQLDGKVALVTGGASGLGAAIVDRFLAAGARVASFDLQPQASESSQWLGIEGDVSDPAALEKGFEAVVGWAGRIDCLVSNAAIQPHGISLEETTPELLDRVFRVNSHAIFFGLQLAGATMKPGGSVIHTGSFVGDMGVPNCPSYAAAKAAVHHLTRVGAIELAEKGIRVNCVAPGLVMTPAVSAIPNNPEPGFMAKRTPFGRAAEVEDITPVYEFLASDEARFVTGAVIPVDGGVAAGWNRYALAPPQQWVNGRWEEGAEG